MEKTPRRPLLTKGVNRQVGTRDRSGISALIFCKNKRSCTEVLQEQFSQKQKKTIFLIRFIIEFFRGDERGQLAGLSPSQYWCILLILLAYPLYILLKRTVANKEREKNDEI